MTILMSLRNKYFIIIIIMNIICLHYEAYKIHKISMMTWSSLMSYDTTIRGTKITDNKLLEM